MREKSIRPAAVAGQFYAKDPAQLLGDVRHCYDEAAVMAPLSEHERDGGAMVQAVIVPHAGYVFSGAVAASAFLRLSSSAPYDRVFLIGPSHHVAFGGASVATAFDAYHTPLGDVPVDRATAEALVAGSSVLSYHPEAHDREHCLEVELPFLQARLKAMPPIVPIIIGTQEAQTLRQVAQALRPYFTPRSLFVISSDFSHYPAYADAERVDGNTGLALESGRLDDFVQALTDNEALGVRNLYTSACGQSAIAVLLMLMQDGHHADGVPLQELTMRHIAYLNSGDSPYGGRDEVVGYHAFVVERVRQRDDEFLTDEDKRQLRRVAWNAISPAELHQPVTPTPAFEKRTGVFVTLTEHGQLRGCIGHFGQDEPLGRLTNEMARAAAFEDPRFMPVREEELKDIHIEISVLTPLHRIHDISEFHYGTDGIYMRKGGRSGTFLPQVADEVNWTQEEFLGHCARDKAGIGWDGWRTAELYTYQAIIF